jgi:hypothetical protein
MPAAVCLSHAVQIPGLTILVAIAMLCLRFNQIVEDILGVLPLDETDAVEYASLLATARKPGGWRSFTGYAPVYLALTTACWLLYR